MINERIALIDVGSNTVRLVIFEITQAFDYVELQNIKTPARLVQYVEDNKMSDEGIDTLVNILSSYDEIIQRYNVQKCFPIATAAIRQSDNAEEIINRCQEQTCIELELLSETQEAYYGNYAVRHTMNISDGITIDIGGGSTEVTLFKDNEVVQSHSFSFGTVSLKQRFFDGKNHNDKKAIKKTRKWIREQFSQIDWIEDTNVPLIGIGGSARNISQVYQFRHAYPLAGIHGFYLKGSALNETVELFIDSSYDELANLDGLSEDRRDIIIPAGLVFIELFQTIDAPIFAISNQGLREGIIIEYINKTYSNPYSPDAVRQQTVFRLFQKYHRREIPTNSRVQITDQLLRELEKHDILDLDNLDIERVHFGAALYYLGSYIEDDSKSQHTFYIVSNTNLRGFSHYERLCIALISSFKNKSLFKQYSEPFDDWMEDKEFEKLMHLGGVVKFAEALNDSHVNAVSDIQLEKGKKGYTLYVTYKGDIIAEEYRANKQLNHFERVLGEDCTINFISEKNSI